MKSWFVYGLSFVAPLSSSFFSSNQINLTGFMQGMILDALQEDMTHPLGQNFIKCLKNLS